MQLNLFDRQTGAPAAKASCTMVCAVSDDFVIGRANGLPWRQRQDLQRFKALTAGKPMLMGGNTYRSLPGILPGREHVVVSRTTKDAPEGVRVFDTIAGALAYLDGQYPAYSLIGGGELYKHFLVHDLVDCIELTHVHATVPDGDTFLIIADLAPAGRFERTYEAGFPATDKDQHPYTFKTFERVGTRN